MRPFVPAGSTDGQNCLAASAGLCGAEEVDAPRPRVPGRAPVHAGARPRVLSFVLPAFGEAENLRQLVPRLLALSALADTLQVVVVDDHSPDETFDVLREFAEVDRRVTGIRLARNCGSHLAMLCGLRVADGDAAVVLAADGQDPPEVVAQLVDAWRGGAQVVWAVRAEREGEGLWTRFFSRLYYALMDRLSDVRLPPGGADFFLIDRRVLDGLLGVLEHRVSLFALVASLGFRQVHVPYVKRLRASGRSKWTLRKRFALVADSLVGFSTLPLRAATAFGFLYATCGFSFAALLLANKLLGGRIFGPTPVLGYAALMIAILVSSGTIMVALGIMGEYLWRALEEARGRPRFLVEDAINARGCGDPRRPLSPDDDRVPSMPRRD